ncbi:MAG: UvrB/UvrC motif-containing protein, partial [Halobacteriota archaeon]
SETTLIQTMGRAARNVNGEVILYADDVTDSMRRATDETQRRRRIQQAFNEEHGYEPQTIQKEVGQSNLPGSKTDTSGITGDRPETDEEAADRIALLEDRMQEAASNLEFELAADIRDRIRDIRREFDLADDGIAPELDSEF